MTYTEPEVMGVEKRKRGKIRRFTTRGVLKALGLPPRSHYAAAHTVLKRLIVQARLAKDDKEAAFLSEVKAFCFKNLNRECQVCRVTLKRTNLCFIHSPPIIKPKHTKIVISCERCRVDFVVAALLKKNKLCAKCGRRKWHIETKAKFLAMSFPDSIAV
jgi:hypothetical protein